jgi:hypothetical protein
LTYDLSSAQFSVGGAPPAIFYDTLIDSPVVPEAERSLLRARMAYFSYRLTDPGLWSAERGFVGTLNMTVVWELSRGLMACAIPEHPMARTWYRRAERIMEHLLAQTGPGGEWIESLGWHGNPHQLLAFALASTNSGLHDYSTDPRLKRMMLHYAKMLMPRDPRSRTTIGWNPPALPNRRYFPAYSRDGVCLRPTGISGAMAWLTRRSDPDYSAVMQWAWREEGAVPHMGSWCGLEDMVIDKHLPARQPAWGSEIFPWVGAVLRHGLGTADEHQVMLYSRVPYPPQIGSFPSIFAYGKPIAGSFPGNYMYQEGSLINHLDLARQVGTAAERKHAWLAYGDNFTDAPYPRGPAARFGEAEGYANVSAFAALPRQDYAAVDVAVPPHNPWLPSFLHGWVPLPQWPPVAAKGKPPLDWRRQVLFLKDDAPAGTAYLLIRDSVKGGQPTMWQMWTVSEKIGTPDEVKDLAAFLRDKPGHAVRPARELKGNRFTAVGQLGVDVEYYIASPSSTPRYTLRWGEHYQYPRNGTVLPGSGALKEPEYQDLMHLQMPGDGVYYVAFFPRKRNMPAPSFQTLGDGKIIKSSGPFGTDYGFLSAAEASAAGEGVTFKGTAASVEDRKSGRVLSLGAKGEVRYHECALAADFAVSLRVDDKQLTLELPEKVIDGRKTLEPMAPFPGGRVTLAAPGNWALAKPLPGLDLHRSPPGVILEIPRGVKIVTLAKQGDG